MIRSAPALYTKAELARHFQVPESTIRYYCSRFAPYLPARGEGRGRRYESSCLEVLTFIRERLPQARTCRAMDALLAQRFPLAVHPGGAAPRAPRPSATIADRFALCEMPENLPCPAEKRASSGNDAALLALRLLERQSDALERISTTLAVLAEHGQQAAALRERADNTDRELEGLRREVRTLRTLLHTAEKTQQDDLDHMRNWLGRLAKEKKQ